MKFAKGQLRERCHANDLLVDAGAAERDDDVTTREAGAVARDVHPRAARGPDRRAGHGGSSRALSGSVRRPPRSRRGRNRWVRRWITVTVGLCACIFRLLLRQRVLGPHLLSSGPCENGQI